MSPESVVLGPVRRRDIARTVDCRQTANDSVVLRTVLDHGPVARSTVARLAGLSPAAVTRLTGDLIAAGLLRESAQTGGPNQDGQKAAGRPHVPVEIDTGRRVACGLHIALHHATLSLADLSGKVLAHERVPHASADPRQLIGRLGGRVGGFLAQHAAGRVAVGLGVAAGGWVDRAGGVMVEHPMLGWRDVPVGELLAAATGLPVQVDNHARALARAEQLFGDPRSRSSVVQLFAGNMIDAAFALGGQVQHGPQSAAGLVAHLPLDGRHEQCVCGRRGCLQAVVSSRELGLRALGAGNTTGSAAGSAFAGLLAAAKNGDRAALNVFRERARLLGAAAALLLDVLNPELLVVAEQGIVHLPGCLEALRAAAGEKSRLCVDPGRSIVASSFGDQVLQVAAAAVILDVVYSSPLRRSPAPFQTS
jgi:predicted NBD/HSP70 family sugar kinase